MPTCPKILHVVVAGQIGGAERLLVSLATHAKASGAEHSVALMTPNKKLRDFFVSYGLKVHDRGAVHENPLAYLWRSYGPSDIAWLGEMIAEEKAQILHCHTYGSHVLTARAGLKFNVAVLRTEHGVRHYRDPSCALNRHWALRHTTRIVAVSSFVAETVISLAPGARAKITVVRNGIDLAAFQPAPPADAGKPFTIAAIARLEPVKRLHLAIAALAHAPDVRLEIAGDGTEREKLVAQAETLGVASRVSFLGYQPDPRPVIAAAHAVVNCTREEGLSLAVMEAAAMQRPAIAFASGGVPEIVTDGETGLLVREETAEALASTLRQTSIADAAQLGIRAGQHARATFGLESMCEGYGAVYRDLLFRG